MTPKDVLVISNLYPSKKASHYGSFVKNFVEELQDSGYVDKVDLCVLRGRSDTIGEKLWAYIKLYAKIFGKLIFRKYDLVYVHLITHATLPVRIVCAFKKLNVVFNIHGEDLLTCSWGSAMLLRLAIPVLKKASYIVVPSHWFCDVTLQRLPFLNPKKIIVSASGGIKQSFYVSREFLGYGKPLIGYVSRIDRGKGWDTLIEAALLLVERGCVFSIKLIGGGLEVPELERLLKQNPNFPVEFVGPIAHDELPNYYRTFDLFVFPTKLEESLGLVGIEPMASGVPVIASRIGGIQDYLIDGKNGFFFTPGNAEDLAEKIESYLNLSKQEKCRFSDNARMTADRYRAEIVADTLFKHLFNPHQ